jgi:acyl carrier protein
MMNAREITQKVIASIAQTFLVDSSGLTPETTSIQVPGWDSVSQVHLVMQLEDDFGIRINIGEMCNILNIRDLVNYISRRMAI